MTTTQTINGFTVKTIQRQDQNTILEFEQNIIPCRKPHESTDSIAPYRNGEISVMNHDDQHQIINFRK